MIRFIIIIILIVIIIFLFSDTHENYDPTITSTTQQSTTQLLTTQLLTTEPSTSQPLTTEPSTSQLLRTQLLTTEPSTTQLLNMQEPASQLSTAQLSVSQPISQDTNKIFCNEILNKKEEIKKMPNSLEFIKKFIINNISTNEEKSILSNCNSTIDSQKPLNMHTCKIQKMIEILIKKENNVEAQAVARILIEILSAQYNIYSSVRDNCDITDLNKTSECISSHIKRMDGFYSSINHANMTKQIDEIKSCIKTKSELTESIKDMFNNYSSILGTTTA
jgi:hypothetical protein